MTVYECEECGGTIFSWNVTKHKCRPRFRIVCDEVCPESAYFRHAASAEDAAMEWVEHQYDPDTDYYVVTGGGSRSIMVAVWQCLVKDGGFTDEYEGEPELYEVMGDFEPIYYANRLNGKDE